MNGGDVPITRQEPAYKQPIKYLGSVRSKPTGLKQLPTMSFYPLPTKWYRLTNLYTGEALSLDVVNDNGPNSSGTLQMAATGNFSGQFWRFQPNPAGSTSTYALYTQFLGEGKRLDVYGNDKTKPHLADAGNYSGQIWTLTPWGDGTYRLTNSFSGSDLHLDVYSDTKQPFLGDGDHSGQHWRITPFAN